MFKKKKIGFALASGVAALGMVMGSAVAANAAQTDYGGVDCTWPTHAFVEATTKGTPTLSIVGGNGQRRTEVKSNSSTFQRNYTNSPDEDAKSAYVKNYTSLQSGGVGCSV